jgi:hypothetical protein
MGKCEASFGKDNSMIPEDMPPLYYLDDDGETMLPVYLPVTISGIKSTRPRAKIEVAATPLTVRSLGLDAKYYVYTGATPTWSATEKVYPVGTGIAAIPLVSEYFGSFGEQPPTVPVLNRSSNQKWAATYSGYFMDTISTGTNMQNYDFILLGAGKADIIITSGSTTVLNSLSNTLVQSNPAIPKTTLLKPGVWYNITIRYWQTEYAKSGITVLWNNTEMNPSPNGNGVNDAIPLSAGCTALPTDTVVNGQMPIPWKRIIGFQKISIDQNAGQGSQCEFSLFLAGANDKNIGYAYDSNQQYLSPVEKYYYMSGIQGDSFTTTPNASGQQNCDIKKGYLVKVSMGYNYTTTTWTGTVYIPKFVGNITSFSTPRSPNNEDMVNVKCDDFVSFCNSEMLINYPKEQDYFGVHEEGDNSILGGTHYLTPAYDGWRIDHAVESLLLRSYIDPTLFFKNRRYLTASGTMINYGRLMEPSVRVGSTAPEIMNNFLRLERRAKYGNPNTPNQVAKDDPYIYKFNFGDNLFDVISTITNNFGYVWGFDPYYDGAPYLMAANNPAYIVQESGFIFGGTWQHSNVNIYSICSLYSYTSTSGSWAKVTATGTRFDLAATAGTGYASAVYCVTRTADNYTVSTGIHSFYHTSDAWHYYNGVDTTIGYNPSIFTIATGLPCDSYMVTISSIGSGLIGLDALLVYGRDADTPIHTFRTVDTLTAEGDVVSLSSDNTISTVRNDVVVLGRAKIKYDVGSNANGEYVQSRATDLDAIYNPSSRRYIGRPIQMLIFDKKIADENRADYISYNSLLRTCDSSQNVTLAGLGNPRYEINDPINVVDSNKNIVSANKLMWIKGIKTSFDDNGYVQSYTFTPLKPWPSYQKKPDSDISIFNNYPACYVNVQRGGFTRLPTNNLTPAQTTIPFENLDYSNPLWDKMFLITRTYPTQVVPYNIIKVGSEFMAVTGIHRATNTGCIDVVRGVRDTTAVSHHCVYGDGTDEEVIWPYDPYYAGNEFGNSNIIVDYYLVKTSLVKVEVISELNGNVVANLTVPGLIDVNGDQGVSPYIFQAAGFHTVSWDATDQFGHYNGSGPVDLVGEFQNPNINYPHNGDTFDPDMGHVSKGYSVTELTQAYGRFKIKITALDPNTLTRIGNVVDSSDMDHEFNPQAWPTVSGYKQTITTLRGPMLSTSSSVVNTLGPDGNNEYGTWVFWSNDCDGAGLQVGLKSVAPSTWDPPRQVKYDLLMNVRHWVTHLIFGLTPYLHDRIIREVQLTSPGWSTHEEYIDAYNDDSGTILSFQPRSFFNFNDLDCIIGEDSCDKNGDHILCPEDGWWWEGYHYHRWGVIFGGCYLGWIVDRTGRRNSLEVRRITWRDNDYSNNLYVKMCDYFWDSIKGYIFDDDTTGHHKLWGWVTRIEN